MTEAEADDFLDGLLNAAQAKSYSEEEQQYGCKLIDVPVAGR
jgi:hypothetical protein